MTHTDNSDYLLISGFKDKNANALNNINAYSNILSSPDTTRYDTILVEQFLIPYNISLLKFILNKDCYENSNFLSDVADRYEVAPSLRKIIEEPFDYKVPAYPDWFYIAFPDVVIWCIEGEGKQLLRGQLEGLTEDELIEDGHLKFHLLEMAIDLFLNHTSSKLECEIHSALM